MLKFILPLSIPMLLTACGGENETPLKKKPIETPTSTTQTQQCGADFNTQRHLNLISNNIVFWQIEGEQLQTKPSIAVSPDKFSNFASRVYSGNESLCQQTAIIFGSTELETWQGTSNTAIKAGQQFGYIPEITLRFAMPDIDSLSDWESKDKPTQVSLNLSDTTLVTWYQNTQEQRFLSGDLTNNQSTLTMSCASEPLSATLSLQPIDENQSANLDKSYCETQVFSGQSVFQCLSIKPELPEQAINCEIALSDVVLPDSQGNKTQVKVSATLGLSSLEGGKLTLTGIEIN